MKIRLLTDRNIAPNRIKAGEIIDLHDDIALRWIEAGIAQTPEMEYIGTIKDTKNGVNLNIVCEGLMLDVYKRQLLSIAVLPGRQRSLTFSARKLMRNRLERCSVH